MDLVNIGGVSNPVLPDLLVRYVLLDADRAGYRVRYRSVRYDQEAVVCAAYAVRYPGTEYIEKFMRGRFHPGWAAAEAVTETLRGAT